MDPQQAHSVTAPEADVDLVLHTVDGHDYVVVPEHGVAVDRWCPHKQGDLADGMLVGSAIKCPLHGYMFDLASGRGMNCKYRVTVRPAQQRDGHWHIEDAG